MVWRSEGFCFVLVYSGLSVCMSVDMYTFAFYVCVCKDKYHAMTIEENTYVKYL